MDDAKEAIETLSAEMVRSFTEKGLMAATAESCTGGMIAAAITDHAGSSAAFDRAFVTYSNAAKIAMLGVDAEVLDTVGAVSGEVAGAMAEGALARSDADIAVAVTGIAGPDGGSDIKPVGTVWFGAASSFGSTLVIKRQFEDRGRAFIRQVSVVTALELLLQLGDSMPEKPGGD
ncbi:CinA family protein [Oceaniradius stylonematis]|uniref:CinA family protein n=1 Tax=Oceaniradius stylonematis TaxID=2184161 RepID=A0A3A8AGI5_9HYPH|nr:CinA family protein [Oceaniradius stylonematis]RKF08199.1 CinA family protein [Oceaniradius stylonematis]